MAVAEQLASGRMVALPWDGPELQVSTYLVWNPQRHLGSAETTFLQHVRKMLAS
jgi:DNA-binding transcriptional LysR family regulator